MKQAQSIAQAASASAAQDAAEKSAIAKDQDWTLGMTKYTFDDNSVLAVRGVQLFGFDADDAKSIRAYGKWVGTESADEVAEIERLLEALEV
jgi:hypothetical protein